MIQERKWRSGIDGVMGGGGGCVSRASRLKNIAALAPETRTHRRTTAFINNIQTQLSWWKSNNGSRAQTQLLLFFFYYLIRAFNAASCKNKSSSEAKLKATGPTFECWRRDFYENRIFHRELVLLSSPKPIIQCF